MPHPTSPKLLYPPTRKDAVVNAYHGTPVADPYRWLEDPQAPDTHAWLSSQGFESPTTSMSGTGIGVVAGCAAGWLLTQGPHGQDRAVHESIPLLHPLQERVKALANLATT